MDELQDINVKEIMDQIRKDIRQQQAALPSHAANLSANGQVLADLTILHTSYDICHLPITSHRRVLGRPIVLVKKILRKLLTPILLQQRTYNAANTRSIEALCQQMEVQMSTVQSLRDTVIQIQQGVTENARRVDDVQQMAEAARQGVTENARRVDDVQQMAEATRQGVTENAQRVDDVQQMAEATRQGVTENTQRVVALEQGVDSLRSMVLKQEEILSDMRESTKHVVQMERVLSRVKTDLILQERRITMLLEEARKRLPAPLTPDQLQNMVAEDPHILDSLYVTFEDQFRGSAAEIQERLRVYLPILQEARLNTDEGPIVDLGSGRGEFLQLLQEEGIRAQGVDLNRVCIEACQQLNLNVIESDAIAYLRGLPDNSIGAVTGFHLIEHLPFAEFVNLLDETVRVLQPGGVAIFETPNPANVLVGSHFFYFDPSHRNPLPSATVKFMAEARGLCRVEIMPLHPSAEAMRVEEGDLEVAKRFNEYFFGPQDYAVVGWKA
jgi:2-polyprenyl-3-methyl-5-hydroxy-6-metoxy-1,4-benzoquinol methylase